MQAAEAWGIPPWAIDEAPALWIERWQAWRKAQNEREQSRQRHQQAVSSAQAGRIVTPF